MQMCTNAMAHKIPNNAETVFLDMLLHRRRYVMKPVACSGFVNSSEQGLLCYREKLFDRWRNGPDGERHRTITKVSVLFNTDIHRNNLTFGEYTVIWDAMHNLIVDGKAERCRKCCDRSGSRGIAFESRPAAVRPNEVFCHCIQFSQSNSRTHVLAQQTMHIGDNSATLAHQVDLFRILPGNHACRSKSATDPSFDLAALHETVIMTHEKVRLDLLQRV